ncbi:Sushi, von Willebrand factor type A, EGF and pentraxin domain-containing protein 1 [Holothuria leucospilota]|uniref:Sushi, von Willebrand factor type A, EGF and pentraxin domain-containing protein 1 n=1 Tax=Holothuria leucospilota TaxID=206669 RepID=A0A9Q0YE26_HOLLE|nr:Sushi, von Willebrand factor type A, EGF and pentraxin domain-containing protein 1 [Holothuria leucospilota]
MGTLVFTESQKVTWDTPTVTDNSGSYTLVQTEGPQQDNEFTVGMTNITYVASDPSGNNASCSFIIDVMGN